MQGQGVEIKPLEEEVEALPDSPVSKQESPLETGSSDRREKTVLQRPDQRLTESLFLSVFFGLGESNCAPYPSSSDITGYFKK